MPQSKPNEKTIVEKMFNEVMPEVKFVDVTPIDKEPKDKAMGKIKKIDRYKSHNDMEWRIIFVEKLHEVIDVINKLKQPNPTPTDTQTEGEDES
jgi:phage-related protein